MFPRSPRIRIKPFAITGARSPAAGNRNPLNKDTRCGSIVQYLLAHGRIDDAQSEISGLAADTPSGDGALREQNGLLFLKVGASGKALEEFEAALQINPRQSEWLADAGQVAFDEGDYLKAEAYFSKADREDPSNKTHGALLLVRDILGNDPFLAGWCAEELARRSRRDFSLGVERLGDCLGTGAKSPPRSRRHPSCNL